MSADKDDRARVTATLARLPLAAAEKVMAVTPLAGGVSGNVFRVDLAGRESVCVEFPAERLRVAARWTAPLRRAGTEHDWVRVGA